MKEMLRKRFQDRVYLLVFLICLSTAFGQSTTQTSSGTLAIGERSHIEISSSVSVESSAITTPTSFMENEDVTGETTFENESTVSTYVTHQMAAKVNDPATGTGSEMSEPEMQMFTKIAENIIKKKLEAMEEKLETKEMQMFTKIAENIIKKKLEAMEEKLDTLTSKLNGEQLRGSKAAESIAFFAQRNSSFDQKNTIQPYLINRLNDGEAFNQASGIFTVPLNGNYHFYFTALKANTEISGTSIITVRLWANKNQKDKMPLMLAEGHVNSNDMHGWFPVTLHATVKLQEKDTVEVELHTGSIHESENLKHLLTSFGGFLVSPETK